MITEGSSKLASVPSGGSGGGAAAASGGAAAGGAAAEETKEEAKEEGMLSPVMGCHGALADTVCREGRVRRGYGFRSLRLNGQLKSSWIRCSRFANTCDQGFWEELCGLCQWFACLGDERSKYTSLLVKICQACRLGGLIQTYFFRISGFVLCSCKPKFPRIFSINQELRHHRTDEGSPLINHVTIQNARNWKSPPRPYTAFQCRARRNPTSLGSRPKISEPHF